jgi:hypothetical protein
MILRIIRRETEALVHWHAGGAATDGGRTFIVLRSDSPGQSLREIALTGELVYRDTGLAPGASHTYAVLESGAGRNVGEMGTPVPVGAWMGSIGSVRGLRKKMAPSGMRLIWESEGPEALYNVYRHSLGEGRNDLPPVNEEPLGEPLYEGAPGPAEEVVYTVRVLIDDPEGYVQYEGPESGGVTVGPRDFPVSPPGGLEAVVVGRGVTVFWNPNPEGWASGYAVYRAMGGDAMLERVATTRTPVFTDRDASPGTRRYMVRAVGPAGEGPDSAVVTIVFPAQ